MRRFVLLCAMAVVVAWGAPAEAQLFFDNFDSYATGSSIAGQGGWETWDNSPAADTIVTDAQSHSSPNSLLVAGAADIVHQFPGVTSGTWYAKAWTYVPSSQAGDLYFIVLNVYNPGGPYAWSIEVRFSASQGIVENANAQATGATLPIILDQWVLVWAQIDIDSNVASIYYGTDLLETQQYYDSANGGVPAIAAFDLFSDGSSESYMDDVWLDSDFPVELQSFDIE